MTKVAVGAEARRQRIGAGFGRRCRSLLAACCALPLLGACTHLEPAANASQRALATQAARVLTLPTTPPSGVARLPVFERLMRDPPTAGDLAGDIEHAFRTHAASPQALTQLTTRLGGIALARNATDLTALDARLAAGTDPLAAALEDLADSAAADLPPITAQTAATASLPPALRHELARLLTAIAQAERFRRRAFAALPSAVNAELLVRQVIDQGLQPFEEPDFRRLLPLVEREALAAGMLDLVAAVERFVEWLNTNELPPLRWEATTALGTVVIDTTGRDNSHTVEGVLLLVDSAGDDTYTFGPRSARVPISVIIDRSGNDRYHITTPATGPAVAVLGYSVLWEGSGNDLYDSATRALGQAAALFGAALLVDEAGDDHYHARSHAQGWAFAGNALLVDREGDDDYHALALAQGSAGAQAVAALVDTAGNDRYTLAAEPLVLPSSQLPDRNLSMGQGAAMGLRAEFSDGRSLPGGLGLLLDFAGDDHYHAQVFAQGAGYFEGTGILIDGGGDDRFDAAWYAMGAAAHRGIGILIKRGDGDDRYHVTHSTSLGAAHDRSLAVFIDEGGNDHYTLGDLGLGGAHDNAVALFTDASGDDRYTVIGQRCLAFGAAHLADPDPGSEREPNIGRFSDLGGNDHYGAACRPPQDHPQGH